MVGLCIARCKDHAIELILLPRILLPKRHRLQPSALRPMPLPPLLSTRHTTDTRSTRSASQHRRPPAIHAPRREAEGCWGCWELLQAKLLGRYRLNWAALNTVSVACSHGDVLPGNARRYDNRSIAVVEEDVSAVRFGEARRGLVEFLSVHDQLRFEFHRFPVRPLLNSHPVPPMWVGDKVLRARVARSML